MTRSRPRNLQPFDQTLKGMLDRDPGAWANLAGYHPTVAPQIIDTHIGRVLDRTVDRVMRVEGCEPYLLDYEFQTVFDRKMLRRLALYRALLSYKLDLPAQCVLVMLKRPPRDVLDWEEQLVEAERQADEVLLDHARPLLGYHCERVEGQIIVTERSRLLKLWELSAEELLEGPIATMPLAAASDLGPMSMIEAIRRMEARARTEIPLVEVRHMLADAAVLLGLRQDEFSSGRHQIQEILAMIDVMESLTAQIVFEQGIKQGQEQGIKQGQEQGIKQGQEQFMIQTRDRLFNAVRAKLGEPHTDLIARLEACRELEPIHEAMLRLAEVDDWEKLIEILESPPHP